MHSDNPQHNTYIYITSYQRIIRINIDTANYSFYKIDNQGKIIKYDGNVPLRNGFGYQGRMIPNIIFYNKPVEIYPKSAEQLESEINPSNKRINNKTRDFLRTQIPDRVNYEYNSLRDPMFYYTIDGVSQIEKKTK